MSFNENNVALTDEKGSMTLKVFFSHKISWFKANFTHFVRDKVYLSISKGENELGGKGKQLKTARTHSEVLKRRKQKRRTKKAQQGRAFFLNYYLSNGEKYIKVRSIPFMYHYNQRI